MKQIKVLMRIVIMIFLWIMVLGDLRAQTQEGGFGSVTPSAASTASYYFISKPGELTMQVNIWGYVRTPGRYEIPTSTDLIQLISYAGGPIPDADMEEVKITRPVKDDTTVLYREIIVNVEKLAGIKTGELGLLTGDTIFIDRTSWASFRDILTVTIPVATVAMTVVVVIITNQNSNPR